MYAETAQVPQEDPEPPADARERGWAALALVTLLALTLLFGTWVFEVLSWLTRLP